MTTPLLLACQNGHLEVVKLLLEFGADPNMPDCFSQTPLLAGNYGEQCLIIDIGKFFYGLYGWGLIPSYILGLT